MTASPQASTVLPAKETITLYTLLNLTSNASEAEIKKAYRRIALMVHPDKNQNDADAAEKFRNLNQAYKVLSDPEKRRVYDETGEYDDNEIGDINDTYDYFREMYPRLKLEDIENFAKDYKGSLMERDDLVNYYEEHEGDLKEILKWIPLSENGDVERFVGIYKEMIEDGVIEEYEDFERTMKSVELLKEEKDFEERAEAEDEMNKLKEQMMIRQKERNSKDMFEHLINKYGDDNGKGKGRGKDRGKGKGKGKMKEMPDIDEEEFQRIQKEMMKKRKNK